MLFQQIFLGGSTAYIPQSNDLMLEVHGVGQNLALPQTVIGDQSIIKDKVMHAARCIGEKILSIKQMLNKNSALQGYFSAWTFVGNPDWQIFPWFIPAVELTPVSGVLRGANLGGDMWSFLAPMYAFHRGGARINFDMAGGTSVVYPSSVRTACQVTPGELFATAVQPIRVNVGVSLAYRNANTAYNASNLWPMNPINLYDENTRIYQHVPYYSQYPMSLNTYFNGVDTPLSEQAAQKSILTVTTPTITSVQAVEIQRSFSDDVQLMFFIGCPPLIDNYT